LTGIGFLTRTGQLSDERRQEFILLSDVLGLSMLTVGDVSLWRADFTPAMRKFAPDMSRCHRPNGSKVCEGDDRLRRTTAVTAP